MLTAERIKQALINAKNTSMSEKVKYNFAINSKREMYTYEFSVEHDFIFLECIVEKEFIEKLNVTLGNRKERIEIVVLDFIQKEPKSDKAELLWTYEGVWTEIIEKLIQQIENEINDRIKKFEKTFRLPSILEGL